MKLTNIMLGGVAVMGLMGAAPALAFTHHPGTPAEHRQTEDLNQQQLQQAQAANSSAATSQTAQAAPATPDQTAQATTNNAPANAQAAAGANDQTAQATTNNAPANAQASAAAPTTTASNAMPLDSVSNPPQTLANASVESSNGQAVGAVQRVITDAAGKAKTVVVALLGKASRLVAIAANELKFDQSRNVVVAQLSADDIQNLPMAPQT